MNRTFSLATLLLLMAVVAIAAATFRRGAIVASNDALPTFGVLIEAGVSAGAVFALVLVIRGRGNFTRMLGSILGGPVLGGAAAAQMSLAVDWPVILAGPAVFLLFVLMAVYQRRQRTSPPSADESRAVENRASC